MKSKLLQKNVDDVRQSPSPRLIELEKRGVHVDYHARFVSVIPPTREHAELAGRSSVPLEAPIVGSYDAILIATDQDKVDYALVVKHARLVVDTPNACH